MIAGQPRLLPDAPIDQHLSFVLRLADRFAVFKRGKVVDSGPSMPAPQGGSTNICAVKRAERRYLPITHARPASLLVSSVPFGSWCVVAW